MIKSKNKPANNPLHPSKEKKTREIKGMGREEKERKL